MTDPPPTGSHTFRCFEDFEEKNESLNQRITKLFVGQRQLHQVYKLDEVALLGTDHPPLGKIHSCQLPLCIVVISEPIIQFQNKLISSHCLCVMHFQRYFEEDTYSGNKNAVCRTAAVNGFNSSWLWHATSPLAPDAKKG